MTSAAHGAGSRAVPELGDAFTALADIALSTSPPLQLWAQAAVLAGTVVEVDRVAAFTVRPATSEQPSDGVLVLVAGGWPGADAGDTLEDVLARIADDHVLTAFAPTESAPTAALVLLGPVWRDFTDSDRNFGQTLVGLVTGVIAKQFAEAELLRSSRRLQALIESAPDALLVLTPSGDVVQANAQAEQLFGYRRMDLPGRPVRILLPFWSHPGATAVGSAGAFLDVIGLHQNGKRLTVDLSVGAVDTGDEELIVLFVRDATSRQQSTETALRLHDADIRRRQAFEFNDNVLQGLVIASYAMSFGDQTALRHAIDSTLAAAREIVSHLLAAGTGQAALRPGDLVRQRAADPSSRR